MITVSYSLLYVFCLAAWILTALYTTIYMQKGLNRSERTYDAIKELDGRETEKLIALRRLEREKTLVHVEQLMFLAGVIAVALLFIPTDIGMIRDVIRATLPLCLVVAHIFLGVHTHQIHTHHHELINRIAGELLRHQFEIRRNAKDVAIAQVNDIKIAVAVIDDANVTIDEETDKINTILESGEGE